MRFYLDILLITLACCMIIHSCSPGRKDEEDILVQIGEKTITVNEFTRRAELTPRPFYCSGSSEKDKRIILNSLIAEKLISLDQPEASDLGDDESFLIYLKGIREQGMRMLLYEQKILNKITIDSLELRRNFNMAGIEYLLKYYTVYDSTLAQVIPRDKNSFQQIFKQRMGEIHIPQKKIHWQDQDNPAVHRILFSKIVSPGTILGPFKTDDLGYLILQVDSVRESKVLTLSEIQERKRLVRERLKRSKAADAWMIYINRLMANKKISFYSETLKKVGKIFEDIYFASDSDQIESVEQSDRLSVLNTNRELMNSPFFRIGDQEWTVQDFKQLIIAHPLIYRKSELLRQDYKFYFQKAIVDLMGDYFLTEEAYKLNLDQYVEITRTVEMWRDALLSKRYVKNYLNGIKSRTDYNPDLMKGDSTYLDIYTTRLIHKYKDQIRINFPAFDQIKITASPMMVVQSLQPHALAVPPFPQFTLRDSVELYSNLNTAPTEFNP